jgi:hypothetical protein
MPDIGYFNASVHQAIEDSKELHRRDAKSRELSGHRLAHLGKLLEHPEAPKNSRTKRLSD